MANKQFIRHLEFYGYPDQNGYSSEASCCDCVDLSEIIKKDLDALSATVETKAATDNILTFTAHTFSSGDVVTVESGNITDTFTFD